MLVFVACSANPPSGIEDETPENGVPKPVTQDLVTSLFKIFIGSFPFTWEKNQNLALLAVFRMRISGRKL